MITRSFRAVFRRELTSYFATPVAIIFLTVFLILSGFFTFKFGNFFERGQADLQPFFLWHPWLYLFIVPAISMRLWAEEKKTGTIELLFTLPISLCEALSAKFLAAWAFIGLALVFTMPIVFTVNYLGSPDMGVIFASYVGSFLMAGAFLAIGIAISAMTNNQIISFVVTTVLCLFLILMGFEPVVLTLNEILPVWLVDHIVNLSFPFHFEAIQRGVVELGDLIYFSSVILVSLYIGAIALESGKAD